MSTDFAKNRLLYDEACATLAGIPLGAWIDLPAEGRDAVLAWARERKAREWHKANPTVTKKAAKPIATKKVANPNAKAESQRRWVATQDKATRNAKQKAWRAEKKLAQAKDINEISLIIDKSVSC